jgi:hypothetical protein
MLPVELLRYKKEVQDEDSFLVFALPIEKCLNAHVRHFALGQYYQGR